MSLLNVLKYGLLIKLYKKNYFEMSFKDFVKEVNMSDDNYIQWSSVPSSLINGFGLQVNNKDKFDIMILKLRLQKSI